MSSVKRLASGLDSNAGSENLIIHYDTMRPHVLGLSRFDQDQDLLNVLAERGLLTIVTISCPADRLLQQYVERRQRSRFAIFRRSEIPLASIYQDGQSLALWSERWDTFLASLQLKRSVVLFNVEPSAERAFEFYTEPRTSDSAFDQAVANTGG